MKDLEHRTNKKQVWLKENILYSSRFKKQLDPLDNQIFIF
ncbi:DUF771 domain-containing protein [Lysinibacillus xylanilyticus]